MAVLERERLDSSWLLKPYNPEEDPDYNPGYYIDPIEYAKTPKALVVNSIKQELDTLLFFQKLSVLYPVGAEPLGKWKNEHGSSVFYTYPNYAFAREEAIRKITQSEIYGIEGDHIEKIVIETGNGNLELSRNKKNGKKSSIYVSGSGSLPRDFQRQTIKTITDIVNQLHMVA